MITVQNLTKRYGRTVALRGISFTVREGEIAGFVGLNGAGKSTAMRILCGFLPLDSGSVSIGPHDVSTESLSARKLVGYLPEGVPHYPEMRVSEFLRYRAALKGLVGGARREAIGLVLKSCGLENVRRRIIGQLSKGFRQRVGLAEALLVNPPYLILDEPTVGLDPLQVRQLRKLFQDIGRERTIIMSTHILSEVEVVCDSIIVIHEGLIIARGTIDEIKRKARTAAGTGEAKKNASLEELSLEEAFVLLVRKEGD